MADIVRPGATPNTSTRPFTLGNGTSGDTWFTTGPSCADSTPIMTEWLNLVSGLLRQSIRTSGAAEAVDDPRMIAEAMARYATGGVVAVQSGNTLDDYDLVPLGNHYGPTGYFNGMKLQFIPTTTNVATGSTRVRYGPILPYKKVFDIAGVDLIAADFTTGYPVSMRYNIAADGGNGAFILDPWSTPNFIPPTPVLSAEYVSPAMVITSGGTVTLTHLLPAKPKVFTAHIKCLTAQHGYSVGDELIVNPLLNTQDTNGRGAAIVPDATNIHIKFGIDGTTFAIIHKTNGGQDNITNSRWEFYIRAFA